MKRKYRLICYAVVGLAIPVTSQLLYPESPIVEVIAFTGLVLVLAAVIEIYNYKKGIK